MLGMVKQLKKAHKQLLTGAFTVAHNFREILEENSQLTVFDIHFDMQQRRWVKLEEAKLPIFSSASSDLRNDHLTVHEIVRLNPDVLNIDEIKNSYESEREVV